MSKKHVSVPSPAPAVSAASGTGRSLSQKIILFFLFGLAAWIMTQNFLTNFMKVGMPAQPGKASQFDGFETAGTLTIVSTMRNAEKNGIMANGGLVFNHTGVDVYYSQSGVHRMIYSVAYALFGGGNLDNFLKTLSFTVAFLLAAGLAFFAYRVGNDFGWLASFVMLYGFLVSDWMVFSARNLYNVFFLQLGPFFLSWILYPRVLEGKLKLRNFLLILGAVVLVKAGSGYEYISNVVMGSAVAPVYYAIARGESFRTLFRHLVWIVGSCIAAVILMIFIHWIHISIVLESPVRGYQVISQKAAARTHGGNSNFEGSLSNDAADPNISVFEILHAYSTFKATSVPFEGGKQKIYLVFFVYFCSSLLIGALAFLDGRLFPLYEKNRRKIIGMACALFMSLVGTMSWPILAKGHMFHHMHLNGMVFYISYMVMFFGALGAVLSLMGRQWVDYIRHGWPRLAVEKSLVEASPKS